jgi:hypothetical protein
MNYLIVFDPSTGHSEITPYADEAIGEAMEARLNVEVALFERGEGREVVILNAKNIDDLRETHARYFGDDALWSEVRRVLGDLPAA